MRGINYYQSKDHEERRPQTEGRRPTAQQDQRGEPHRQANPQRENATENNRANMSGPTGKIWARPEDRDVGNTNPMACQDRR